MNRIGVLQVCDSLAAGGMERVAVNVANALPQDRYRSHLCSTRAEGPMAAFVHPHVGRICLHRNGRFDPRAVERLIHYIRQNDIRILHAHSTALFLSAIVSYIKPHPVVIWHDHFGRYETEERPAWVYRAAARRLGGVIAVNQSLAAWAQERLHVPAGHVRYIPNFVIATAANGSTPALPGQAGSRIVCVANFRPQKDHRNLLEAMRTVLREMPEAHLILLGHGLETPCYQEIHEKISRNGLNGHVSVLGPRDDVPAVLRACDIGVLSSSSEGLPLALLEYGLAGLAVAATKVGQCDEVLAGGKCGLLVPARDPDALAKALLLLLGSVKTRQEFGRALNARVRESFSPESAIEQITAMYENALTSSNGARRA